SCAPSLTSFRGKRGPLGAKLKNGTERAGFGAAINIALGGIISMALGAVCCMVGRGKRLHRRERGVDLAFEARRQFHFGEGAALDQSADHAGRHPKVFGGGLHREQQRSPGDVGIVIHMTTSVCDDLDAGSAKFEPLFSWPVLVRAGARGDLSPPAFSN